MNTPHIAEQVRAVYSTFSKSERSLADVVLGTTSSLGAYTATELAREAGVSKATVTRFINKCGYATYQEFRRAVKAGKPTVVGSPLELLERGLATTEGNLGTLMSETLRSDQDNLAQTYGGLDLAEVERFVQYCVEAETLFFVDFRKQYALAYYAATLFRTIRPGVVQLPSPGATPVDFMLDITPADVVVTFPFRRPTREQETLSAAVKKVGATLIAVGDIWPTPPNQKAEIHLRCYSESPGVFDSFVAPMSVINLLFAATANELGEDAKQRLQNLEHHHMNFQTFLDGYNTVVKQREQVEGAGEIL